jgi:biopolymer transport protein ExbD
MGMSVMNRRMARKRSSSFNSINVTPLLDVLLVLLIIFMMTAQMVHNDVDLNLPQVSTKNSPKSSTQDDMKVYINAKQEISIGEDKIENLDVYLASIDEKTRSDSVVVIGDLGVPYQKLIEVLVSLNSFGFTKVKMAYDKK